MENQNIPEVYAAINRVQSAMAREGIAKARKNQQQGYAFRGIDDVYASLAPHLAQNGLCILPRVISHEIVERQTKAGGALFYTTLKVEFDFVSVKDGSKHTICTIGEAMDSGDKSSNKGMSAAYKYACFISFSIPTEGNNDADFVTHPTIEPKLEPVQETPKFGPRGTVSTDTVRAISAMCADGTLGTIVDKSLKKLGLWQLDEMSEEQGQTLLKALTTKAAKTK